MAVADHTGLLWLKVFDDLGDRLLGVSAEELEAYRFAEPPSLFNDILRTARGRVWEFVCEPKDHSWEGQHRVQYTVRRIQRVDWSHASRQVCRRISEDFSFLITD